MLLRSSANLTPHRVHVRRDHPYRRLAWRCAADTGRLAGVAGDGLRVTDAARATDALLVAGDANWQLGGVDWSADNSMILYGRSHSTGLRRYQINVDGSQFTQTGYFASNETPSPDGSRVVWTENVDGVLDVYVGDPGRRNPVHVDLPNAWVGRSWSPDGSRFVVNVRPGDGAPGEAWFVASDGTILSRLGADAAETYWSPDGRFLAVNSWTTGLRVLEPDTGFEWSVSAAFVIHTNWTDAETLAFTRSGYWGEDRDAYQVRYDGSGLSALSTDYDVTGAVVAPGGQLAVVTRLIGNEASTIVVRPATGEVLRELPSVSASVAAWSPDGRTLAIIASSGESYGLYIVNAETGEMHQVAWGGPPDHVWWLDDHTIAFEYMQGGL